MPQKAYESRARGGPKHGIKLTSGLGWDGRIIMRRTPVMIYYHAGSYKWHPIEQAWIWNEHPVPPESVNRKNNTHKPCLDRRTKTTY